MEIIIRENPQTSAFCVEYWDDGSGDDVTPQELRQEFGTVSHAKLACEVYEKSPLEWESPADDSTRDVLSVAYKYY